ncbi:MAG TPA: addiction module protein [Allocoleopsis sp.]
MLSIEIITEEALSLPNNLRIELVEKLMESLEFNVDESLQKTWLNIAKKRRDEINNGEVIPIDGDQALAKVREIIEL